MGRAEADDRPGSTERIATMARNSQAPVVNPPVTFTPEQLQAVIAQAIAEHEASKAQKAKADTSTEMEKLAVKAFRRAGFGEVLPRVDTKTYGLWVADGFKVKEGEKSIKVKQLRLFHRSQVEPITKAEQAEYLAKRAAKTADKLPPVSPVSEPSKPAAKTSAKTAKAVPIQGTGSMQ
jgi:hypothetical protein